MIDVALLGIIRRWHLRDQVSLREIARRLGISRNTVRRYLRAESVEPTYASRRSSTSLDTYALKLSTWLKTEAAKSRKQKRSLKQMHIDRCALGYEGSYDRVAAFARQWKVDQFERVNSASKSTVTTTGRLIDRSETSAVIVSDDNVSVFNIAGIPRLMYSIQLRNIQCDSDAADAS